MLTGVARCLGGTNIIKTAEEKKTEKETIMKSAAEELPAQSLSAYRFVHNPTWCDFGQTCKNGAVLPRITQKNQSHYLPPQDRGVTPASTGLATVS